jgi:hypothetical protein
VTAIDHSPFKRGDWLTVTGKNFLDVTEASGGGAASANSDQRHPIWILQSIEGSGGGSSQSNSGFILDLTSRVYQNSGMNSWANINSSITVQLPASIPAAHAVGSEGYLLPYGWYSLRVGANDQLSPAYMVQAGPPLPKAPVTFNASQSFALGTSSVTFTWNSPSGLAPGVNFDGYNVYIASTQVWISTLASTSNSITLTNLSPGSVQQIMVMPYNISGDYPIQTYSPTVNTAQGLTAPGNVYGVGYATDTIKWSWTSVPNAASYNIISAISPGNVIASGVTTFAYNQTGLTQNTPSVIQVQAVGSGGLMGPLSTLATAYSLAAAPVFTAQSCPNNNSSTPGITTGSVVTQWQIWPGGPGPAGNAVTYQVEYATGNWNRLTGSWNAGIIASTVSVVVTSVNQNNQSASTSATLGNLNPGVPVYIRARALNTAGQYLDPAVNSNYGYTSEWVDLVSSVDFSTAGFTSTLPLAPTSLSVSTPSGPTSTTLSWQNPQPSPTLLGYPQTRFQVLQSTCVINGIPDFSKSSGPLCGVAASGLNFANLTFSSNTVLAANLATWATYYFQLNAENPPHWEGNAPNQVDSPPIMPPYVFYYANVPGAAPGTLAVSVSARYGGSISNASVGIIGSGPQHTVSFNAPGAAFPSDTVVTISTVNIPTDPRLTQCPGSGGTLCGGDPKLAFAITASPQLQPTAPLYFTVAYNSGEPNVPGMTDPTQAVLLRFDPASCKCVPERNPGASTSNSITAEINSTGIFQVGTAQASTTPVGMRIYPNPYYTARDGWMTIDGIPAASRVRIFTLRGELVLDGSADGHGIFTWQGANRGGRAVASGVYLVVVEGNGLKAIEKLAVIR